MFRVTQPRDFPSLNLSTPGLSITSISDFLDSIKDEIDMLKVGVEAVQLWIENTNFQPHYVPPLESLNKSKLAHMDDDSFET